MKKYIILGLIALVVAIGAGYGIINKMQQQEIALSERAMLNLEALARGESPPGGCENPPGGGNFPNGRTAYPRITFTGEVIRLPGGFLLRVYKEDPCCKKCPDFPNNNHCVGLPDC